MREHPERLVIEATREKLAEAWRKLANEMSAAASAESSWILTQELHGYSKDGNRRPRETVVYDARDHAEVTAGYKTKIERLEGEVKQWEDALTHAITALDP